MAYIPVRRKRRGATWLWPLIALGLFALVGSVVVRSRIAPGGQGLFTGLASAPPTPAQPAPPAAASRPAEVQAPAASPDLATPAAQPAAAPIATTSPFSVPAAPAPAPTETLASLPIGQQDALAGLVGKRARLAGMQVQEVVGDKTFWIGPNPTRHILVYLDEDEETDDEVEVRAGQTVNLTADVKKLPSLSQIADQWDIIPDALDELAPERVYLYVDDVSKFRIVAEP